jgi:hypothetical protein
MTNGCNVRKSNGKCESNNGTNRKLLFAILAATLCALSVSIMAMSDDEQSVEAADTVKAGDITISYAIDGGTVKITGYEDGYGNLVIPETIDGYPVDEVGDNAFRNCTAITRLTLPARDISYGDGAFYGCIGIEWIDIHPGNPSIKSIDGAAFSINGKVLLMYPAKSSRSEYVIPSGVEEIDWGAFTSSVKLTSLTLPSTLKEIKDYAFYGCTGLRSITIPASVTSIGRYALWGCTSLDRITVASGNPIYIDRNDALCMGSTLITYPSGKPGPNYTTNNITVIESGAFVDCKYLVNVTLHGVDTVKGNAFQNCKVLETVNFSSVKTIGQDILYGCDKVTTVTVPASVTDLDDWAFRGCAKLTEIVVSSGNMNYTSESGVLFSKDKTVMMSYPAGKPDIAYTVPSTVKTIKQFAFYDNILIETVTIPNSVTSMSNGTFVRCISLKAINIDGTNSNCVSVDGVLFNKEMTTLILYPSKKAGNTYTIPASVTVIEHSAFKECINLASVNVAAGNTSFVSVDGVLFNAAKTDLILYPGSKAGDTYTIPSSVRYTYVSAFDHSVNLRNIYVESDNTVLSSSDGVLLSDNGRTIIEYPGGRTGSGYVVPNGINGILTDPFNNGQDSIKVLAVRDDVRFVESDLPERIKIVRHSGAPVSDISMSSNGGIDKITISLDAGSNKEVKDLIVELPNGTRVDVTRNGDSWTFVATEMEYFVTADISDTGNILMYVVIAVIAAAALVAVYFLFIRKP